MEIELQKCWVDDVDLVIERVIEKHSEALTAFVSASEVTEIKKAYHEAFFLIWMDVPEENWAAAFEEAVQKAVDRVVALGPDAPPKILRDHRLLKEMGSLAGYVYKTARNVVSEKAQLTPEMREKLENAYKRLHELDSIIRSECPYLLDGVGSPPADLWLNAPRGTRKRLGDAWLDCRYLLGKSRFMSLDLGHCYQDAHPKKE
jgi:hypothetical protein